MKNSAKRILSFTLVLILILSVAAVLSGCYVVKSGKMSQIEGTYQLTGYSGKTNYLEEREITLFMVIRGDGTGYYAYKSNTEEPHIAELRCRFTSDPENPGTYSYVEINFTGSGEPCKLAVNAPVWDIGTNLNSQTIVWKPIVWGEPLEVDYHLSVSFKRVDRATDLSYINNNFGAYTPLPHGVLLYDGTYEINNIESTQTEGEAVENPYVYLYVKLDLVDGTAKTWYMLKENEQAIEETHRLEVVKGADGTYFEIDDRFILTPDTYYGSIGNYTLFNFDEVKVRFANIGYYTEEEIESMCEGQYNIYLESQQ